MSTSVAKQVPSPYAPSRGRSFLKKCSVERDRFDASQINFAVFLPPAFSIVLVPPRIGKLRPPESVPRVGRDGGGLTARGGEPGQHTLICACEYSQGMVVLCRSKLL